MPAGSRPARADDNPADALIGTLVETEEDIRVRGTDLVKTLLERSELNRDKYKKELQDKYCYRYANVAIHLEHMLLMPARDVSGHALCDAGRPRTVSAIALVSE